MRWGVRDEATDDHMTTELCMKEIDNCQRLSMGPNFVVRNIFNYNIMQPLMASRRKWRTGSWEKLKMIIINDKLFRRNVQSIIDVDSFSHSFIFRA